MLPPDLRIAIYFAANGGGEFAPEGPGWYLYVTRIVPDDRLPQATTKHIEEIIPRVRLSAQEVLEFAPVVMDLANGKPLNWTTSTPYTRAEVSLHQAIDEENERARTLLEHEVAEAERAIQNLDILRRRVEEFKNG